MNNPLLTQLSELGLNDKEARIYLAALKLGATTAQCLALESEVKRASVYTHIESLIAKGLIHEEISGVRKLFVAESPNQLASILDKQQKTLNFILPQLMQNYLHVASSTNVIKIYHGLSGIKLIYDTILDDLKPKDEYLVISDQNKWHTLEPEYFEAFILKRAKLDLVIRLILQNTEHATRYQNKENDYREKIKLLPKHMILNMNMIILPTKVIMIQIVDPIIAIIIENANVVAMNRVLFHTIWELIV